MKILIDGRAMQTYSAFRGIGRYVNQLIDLFHFESSFHFLFFREDNYRPELERKLFLKAPRRLITFTDHLLLHNLLRREAISLYHSPAFALPRRPNHIRYILTIHDLTPLIYPEYSSSRNRYIFKKIIKSALGADLVIAVSQHTADDLLNYLPQLEGRIRVVHNALDRRIDPGSAESPRIKLPLEFMLYCGGADKIKNLKTVVRSLSFHELPLVIAGKADASDKKELYSLVGENDRPRIYFTGFVSDRELSYLYKKAKVFAFPSLYEGFGYPPLEALYCGTPSVVSRCSSIPEVMGDSALYVDDPLDPEAFAAKVNELITDTELENELLRSGKTVLETHSMETYENRIRAIYDELLMNK
jgi:glycosyltransferase involved in cell wall biosynthesis